MATAFFILYLIEGFFNFLSVSLVFLFQTKVESLSNLGMGLFSIIFSLCLVLYFAAGLNFLRPQKIWLPLTVVPLLFALFSIPITGVLLEDIELATFIRGSANQAILFQAVPWFGWYTLTAHIIQIVVGALTFRAYLDYRKTTSKEAFQFKSLCYFSGAHLVVLIFGLPLFIQANINIWVEGVGKGSVLYQDGKFLGVEETYIKNDRRVILVPMAHIAKKEFYHQLTKDFNGIKTLFLKEGVRDSNGLIKNWPDYERAAENLGLSSQKNEFDTPETRPEKIHYATLTADVDTSELKVSTIATMNELFKDQEKNSNEKNSETLERLIASTAKKGTKKIEPEELASFFDDIIGFRNLRLMETIDKTLTKNKYNRIIVPWGALHMFGIKKELVVRGFKSIASKTRTIISLETMAKKWAENKTKKTESGIFKE
jgi:uncharacterized membrane protein